MITITDLSKKYGPVQALKSISSTIRSGEITGILGPNGAGKTTLLKIISCYMYPTSGSVDVDGFNVFKNSIDIRKKIGYLPENAPLYTDLSVIDYLRFVAKIRNIPSKLITERIGSVSRSCGIKSVALKRIDALSKGYRQRVGLAQALIHNPDIIILDEPTSGLDPNQILEIRDMIKELGKAKTMLFSSHILQEVQAVCDRALIINKGEIVGDGDPDSMHSGSSDSKVLLLTIRADNDISYGISDMPEVNDLKVLKRSENDFSYRIESEKDIRETLFDLCVSRNARIIEMRMEKHSLEKIFRELTTKRSII